MVIFFPVVLFAQNGQVVKGRITDKQSGHALAGATIAIKGTSTSMISDNLGNFKLLIQQPGKIILAISYVGYETMELPVNTNDGNTGVDIALSIDERVGNAIVVSASKRPEKITNAPASIQVIGKKELEEFLTAIEQDKQPIVNEIDGYRAMEVAHQILHKIHQNLIAS